MRVPNPLVVVAVGTIGFAISATAASGSTSQTVTGSTVSAVTCAPTTFDPSTDHVICTGTSTWVGNLTGETVYTADTTYDPVTGAGAGTETETFYGRSSDGRTGTLQFTETLTTTPTGIPDTGTAYIVATVVGGTGRFAGARGTIVFAGTLNAAEAMTGYRGRLTVP